MTENDSLKNKTILGMIWSAVQRFGTMILSFISNLILARLLSPNDFGCIGMLAIFISLSSTFIDGGFGAALVQKSNPTQRDYSTIFFWNLTLALLLYLLIWISSPLVASFYEITIIEEILQVQALVLIINSIGLVHRVQLRKSLCFKKLAYIDLSSSLIAVPIAIFAAYSGLGVWSLVIYQLMLSLVQTLALWLCHRWLPSLVFDIDSFKSLFKYGGFLLVSDLLNTICDNIQGLIIGKQFSPYVMGYYAQAKKLEEIPTTCLSNIVAQVSFPVFSSIRNDISTLRIAHRKCVHATNFINIPLMSLLILIAEPLIIFLFTDKWLPSVPYFQILCVAGLANCLQSINYQLYLAMGFSKSMFRWNLFKRSIGVLLILIGAIFGVEGILWGMVLGFWLTYFVNASLAGGVTGYTLGRQLYELLPIVIISLISTFVSYCLGQLLDLHYCVELIFQIVVFIIVYIVISSFIKLYAFDIYKQILYSAFRK